jgi:hypothetical protein
MVSTVVSATAMVAATTCIRRIGTPAHVDHRAFAG